MQVVDRVWAATGLLDGLFPTPSTTCIHAGVPSRRIPDILSIAAAGLLPSRRIQDFLSIAAAGLLPSRRIPDILSIAATGLLPSRRIQDILSIAATGLLPSRRIPDILSINEGRDKSRPDLFRASITHRT